ncbi:MAG: FliH/SctL family protein [Desulfobulbus sp.]|jgi:flagellar assembly protein FliH
MSSSKVFRTGDQFTPTSLVRITLPAASSPAEIRTDPVEEPLRDEVWFTPDTHDAKPEDLDTPPESEHAEHGEDPEAAHLDGPEAEVAEHVPEPEPEPEPEPVPPPPDLEALRKEAYAQGMADQAERMQTELGQAVQALHDACQKLDEQRQLIVQQSRGDLVNLVMTLTRKVVGMELATPRTTIVATLKAALEQAIGCEEYYVVLHPDDLALAEQSAPELIDAIRGLERIIFRTDDTITPGGCLLESEQGSVDATIEGQLASMETLFDEHPELIADPSLPLESSEPEQEPSASTALS